jgi:hypothetical protein
MSSPQIEFICICANWKMQGVMNRYIWYEPARDQYVGRSVSGCSCLKKEFAESFPYWGYSDMDNNEKMAVLHNLIP